MELVEAQFYQSAEIDIYLHGFSNVYVVRQSGHEDKTYSSLKRAREVVRSRHGAAGAWAGQA